MVEARHFKENMSEIIKGKDLQELKSYYEKLSRNINNYAFPKLLENKVNYKVLEKNVNYKIPEKKVTYKTQLIRDKLERLEIKLQNRVLQKSREQQTAYGEAWKKYLYHINKLINEGKRVQTKILAESVGVNTRNTRKNIQKLINWS